MTAVNPSPPTNEAATLQPLAEAPRILDLFDAEIVRLGVVGERNLARLLFLAVTSRMLQEPVSVAIKGPSSGGKSFLVEGVLKLFPQSAYYELSAMSERFLAYSEEPLKHRFIVFYEAAGMASDFASYLVRSLLSEGKVKLGTVESSKGGLKPKVLEKEGPTGLIVTTTQVRLHPENETRLLSLTVTDTQEQTKAVLRRLAQEKLPDHDLSEWHALQAGLEAHRGVAVPFAGLLAELVPPVAVRLRRDFGKLLALIRTHALLHSATRDRDEHGQVIATIDDYAVVRELVADLIADGVESTVPETVRETVEAVRELTAAGGGWGDNVSSSEATVSEVAQRLQLDKSAAYRRVQAAISRRFVQNMEDRRGRPARLVLGEPMPEDVQLLPTPEQLEEGCTVAGVSGGEAGSDIQVTEGKRKLGATIQRCAQCQRTTLGDLCSRCNPATNGHSPESTQAEFEQIKARKVAGVIS